MNTTFQIITSLTGLVGTIGGVFISYLSLRHIYRKDRHEVNLNIAVANILTSDPQSGDPDWSEDMLTFKLANTGAKAFTVVSLGLKLGKRSGSMLVNRPDGTVSLPYELKPDNTCDFWAVYDELTRKVRKRKPRFRNKIYIRGYVRDYIGNTFYSKKMPIYIKETTLRKARLKIRRASGDFIKQFLP